MTKAPIIMYQRVTFDAPKIHDGHAVLVYDSISLGPIAVQGEALACI